MYLRGTVGEQCIAHVRILSRDDVQVGAITHINALIACVSPRDLATLVDSCSSASAYCSTMRKITSFAIIMYANRHLYVLPYPSVNTHPSGVGSDGRTVRIGGSKTPESRPGRLAQYLYVCLVQKFIIEKVRVERAELRAGS
jgi:hypothetical protein